MANSLDHLLISLISQIILKPQTWQIGNTPASNYESEYKHLIWFPMSGRITSYILLQLTNICYYKHSVTLTSIHLQPLLSYSYHNCMCRFEKPIRRTIKWKPNVTCQHVHNENLDSNDRLAKRSPYKCYILDCVSLHTFL